MQTKNAYLFAFAVRKEIVQPIRFVHLAMRLYVCTTLAVT